MSQPPQPDSHRARSVWQAHQADRAWIEWGLCLAPISIRRPRCVTCADAWPCPSALAAHTVLAAMGPPASDQPQPDRGLPHHPVVTTGAASQVVRMRPPGWS